MRKENNKGITLIALVVTIIVLLILVAVTLSLLLGDNGIIKRAVQAKEDYIKAAEAERQALAELDKQISLENLPVEKTTDKNPGVLEEENGEFIINSIEDLIAFSNNVNTGNTYEGKTVKVGIALDFLSNDSYVNPNNTDLFQDYNGDGITKGIKEEVTDKNGRGFIPIGNKKETDSQAGTYFLGTFDGNEKVIKNIYEKVAEVNNEEVMGLFGNQKGTLKNIWLTGELKTEVATQGTVYIGSICAVHKAGIISKCYSNVVQQISSQNAGVSAGGMVGLGEGVIEENTYVGSMNIKQNEVGNIVAGGICGNLKEAGEIRSCVSKANMETQKNDNNNATTTSISLGGIVGSSVGKVNNSNVTAEKLVAKATGTGKVQLRIGGIVGVNNTNTIVQKCTNKALMEITQETTSTNWTGGIAGYNNATIEECLNIGTIISRMHQSFNNQVGGIAGCSQSSGVVANCRNEGNIQGITIGTENINTNNVVVGGIVGSNYAIVKDAYNVGLIEGETALQAMSAIYAGGIVGYNRKTGEIENCMQEGNIQTVQKANSTYIVGGITAVNFGNVIQSNTKGHLQFSSQNSNVSTAVGGIVGINYTGSNTDNCHNAIIVKGDSQSTMDAYVGGVVGQLSGTLTNSSNAATIEAQTVYFLAAGGVVGKVEGGTMDTCHNTGEMITSNIKDGTDMMLIGGVFGYAQDGQATIKNTYNSGNITLKQMGLEHTTVGGVGGVLGEENDKVVNSYNTGKINVEQNAAAMAVTGGVLGYNHGKLENCYNMGEVHCIQKKNYNNQIGGIVGTNRVTGIIQNCYNSGTIIGQNDDATVSNLNALFLGGVVGYNYGAIDNSYHVGTLTKKLAKDSIANALGGIVGISTGTVTACLYDSTSATGGIDSTDSTNAKKMANLKDNLSNYLTTKVTEHNENLQEGAEIWKNWVKGENQLPRFI